MIKEKRTGQTCVGEVRLAPLDVGFDIRDSCTPIFMPDNFSSVGYEDKGDIWYIEGTKEEMVEELRRAGYKICRY